MTITLKNVDKSIVDFLLSNLPNVDMEIKKEQKYSKKFIKMLDECEEELKSGKLKSYNSMEEFKKDLENE